MVPISQLLVPVGAGWFPAGTIVGTVARLFDGRVPSEDDAKSGKLVNREALRFR